MIRFEKVTKKFGRKVVLDNVDLEIEDNETFVIVGTSGAGKSVSLKHMVRLLTPDSGRVWIGDDVISEANGPDLERIRARFGVLFQSAALLEWLNVKENVALPLREREAITDEAAIDQMVNEKLQQVNLKDINEIYPSSLSGGMRKRVGLARAIVTKPEIILYDEPTSGLDPVTSRTIDNLIDSLRRQLGVTSVVVTHDLHSALAIATRIAMLHEGKMIEIAPPAQFIESKNEIVRSFLDAQYITKRGSWEKVDQK
ncbi:MAG TPA: ABC transporter ATP-binding protein [Verrucomicrobia bacterium]|nr:MAG: hypothetical protein A2X46_08315 [Lentisphaerae bacterium GWF2_57_35]HBA83684.1 ABC transporter ATP-binding protein [Verrucomicrobiota bacterium]